MKGLTTLAAIVEWYTLKGCVDNHYSFMDDFDRESVLWYFHAIDGDFEIAFNYRKYHNKAFRLYRDAHITRNNKVESYDTITALKEALR